MPETQHTEEPFNLAPRDASELVGMSIDSLAALADRGDLPCRKTPGGHRRYRRSDVVALLTEGAPAEAQS